MDGVVGGVRVDETGEAADASRYIDRLQEIRDGFAEAFHIVVGGLADDDGVGVSEIAEEGFDFFRCSHGDGRRKRLIVRN